MLTSFYFCSVCILPRSSYDAIFASRWLYVFLISIFMMWNVKIDQIELNSNLKTNFKIKWIFLFPSTNPKGPLLFRHSAIWHFWDITSMQADTTYKLSDWGFMRPGSCKGYNSLMKLSQKIVKLFLNMYNTSNIVYFYRDFTSCYITTVLHSFERRHLEVFIR